MSSKDLNQKNIDFCRNIVLKLGNWSFFKQNIQILGFIAFNNLPFKYTGKLVKIW